MVGGRWLVVGGRDAFGGRISGHASAIPNGSFDFAQDDRKGMLDAGGFSSRWSVVGAL